MYDLRDEASMEYNKKREKIQAGKKNRTENKKKPNEETHCGWNRIDCSIKYSKKNLEMEKYW